MELKIFDKSVSVGFSRRFKEEDLYGENVVYGGIFVGTGSGRYIFISWIEDEKEEKNLLLNTLVEMV